MTTAEIKEKLAKAEEVVTKKENTLKKYEAKVEKLKNIILDNGWDLDAGRYQLHDENGDMTDEAHDCYWTFCDYEHALDDIRRTKEAIEEKKAVVDKWKNKLAETEQKNALVEQFPEIFKEFQEHVIEMWDEWDKNRREFLRKEYAKLEEEETKEKENASMQERRSIIGAFKKFINLYRYAGYEFMHISDEEIHKANVKASERLILNLWNRISEIVGEVTDYSGLHITQGNEWEGTVINGIVEGTNGKALVETIGAGGWNIQKFHYRTLVKRIK